MTEIPRDYEREYTKPLPGALQIRIGVTTDRGEVTRFLVQLEYWIEDGWRQVVRYDHDPESPDEMAHDVTKEGLHMDVYREGEKIRTEGITPPLPADIAFNHAEEHLTAHLEEIVQRFEQWHGIKNP